MKKLQNIGWVVCLAMHLYCAAPLWAQTGKTALRTGVWKASLHRNDGQDIAFTFTVEKHNGKTQLYVHNADENLLVDSLRQNGDSLWIQMPFFNSGFAARLSPSGNNLQGRYIKNYGNRVMTMPFTAQYNNAQRYPAVAPPAYNVSGKWQVQFEGEDSVLSSAIGEFVQEPGGKIKGTFLTPTGDYRYLEGRVNADSLQLSAFDGGHAILFTARLSNDSTISQAAMYSGVSPKQSWTAKRNENAKLPDSYNITKMRAGETGLSFRFPSTDSIMVSLSDARYKDKVIILQILGSWCPNCMDETGFLSKFYKENKHKGVEVIGLAYERTEDFAESREALQPFLKRFDVQYPFLITGVTVTDEKRTEKTLPQLNNLVAFPTTIFIDKNGNVAKIHTGYDGPATGTHHEAFKEEFEQEINRLLGE